MALSVSHYSTAAPAAAPLSRWSSSRHGGEVLFDDPLAPPRADLVALCRCVSFGMQNACYSCTAILYTYARGKKGSPRAARGAGADGRAPADPPAGCVRGRMGKALPKPSMHPRRDAYALRTGAPPGGAARA